MKQYNQGNTNLELNDEQFDYLLRETESTSLVRNQNLFVVSEYFVENDEDMLAQIADWMGFLVIHKDRTGIFSRK